MNGISRLSFLRGPRLPASLASADRQLARSVLVVFLLASGVAVLGPLISYRSDLSQLQDMFRTRVVREAGDDANALDRHLHLLQSELERLASRPEVNLLDASLQPEQELLDSAHRSSTLFDSGVAILDVNGQVLWSEPASLKATGIGTGDWFVRVAGAMTPRIDLSDASMQTVIVAVPVLRGSHLTGVLVGLSRAARAALSPVAPTDPLVTLLRDSRGGLSLPEQPPHWADSADFESALRALPEGQGAFSLSSSVALFASAARVGDSGLSLVKVGNEEEIIDRVRSRFRIQMALLLSLQIGAVFLLSLFLRRTYTRFLEFERRAVEQDRLLSLGTASSLIAHEVKNSLNGLQAAASLLALTDTGGEAALPLKSLRGEVDRLKHLASSLLLFGKPADVQPRKTSLNQLAREVVDGLQVLPESEEVSVELVAPEDVDVVCDPLLLTTAMHNLARNAVEATVAAKDLGRVRQPKVLVRVAKAGEMATIEVEDNAGGVLPDVAAQLFEPFVTGKPKGIGLGLSMTRRAMVAQGGSVSHEAIPGGSRFILRLPTGSAGTD